MSSACIRSHRRYYGYYYNIFIFSALIPVAQFSSGNPSSPTLDVDPVGMGIVQASIALVFAVSPILK